ncbi:recombinase family protein [uncultured Agathobaculum sp.]|uniref:recombinase family protein n=1 Tax=uncultured Agathobaculum sp. TaxID=2048140 RepID=UPI0032099BB5
MSTQYCIYLRKSRQDLEAEARGEGDTLARHRRTLTELAEARSLPVGAIYEEVVSGDTIAARPQMQRLLQEVEAGQWRGVIVMEIERLARGDNIDQGIVARAFKYSETRIITPFKTFDPNNEYDEEYFEFGLFMSRREYKTIRRRLNAGVQAARREGKYTAGQPPFGYRKIKLKGEKGGSLEPDPQTAPIVQNVFHWFIHEDVCISQIKKRLNRLLPPPPGARNQWTDRRVSLLLHNPHYAGYTTSTRRPTRKEVVDGQLKVVRLTAKDVQLYEGRHEALVSREDWHRAQEILASHPAPPVPAGKGQKNAFTGLIVCGVCGRKMQRNCISNRQTIPREPLIFCVSRSACPTISHRYDEIERMVLDTLRLWLSAYTSDGSPFSQQDETAPLRASLQLLDKRLSELDARISRAFELVETGVYTPALYLERKNALDAERTSLLRQQGDMQAELEQLEHAAANRRAFVLRLQHVLDAYEQADNAREQNRLLKTVIEKIVYTKTERVTTNRPGNLHLQIYPLLPSTPVPML